MLYEDYQPAIPDPLRAYMRDELDIAAYKLYLCTPQLGRPAGFHPPERPDGFLDPVEAIVWNRWREKARNGH